MIDLPGTTLLPGLIDAHTHVLLHPYNEATWDDQVLKEPLALRVCRATNHLREQPALRLHHDPRPGDRGGRLRRRRAQAGGRAGDRPRPADAGRRPGRSSPPAATPRKGFAPEWHIPQGAEEADGVDALIRVVRDQIGRGADWIKVYADAAMGGRAVRPDVLARGAEADRRDGRGRPASRSRPTRCRKEGMRRAALAGVETIEHGDGGDVEVFRLMAERGVALCPTLAAAEATTPLPRLAAGRRPRAGARSRPAGRSSSRRCEAGVTIVNGSDMGVFAHGDGAREIELHGRVRHDARPRRCRAATSVAARVLRLDDRLGRSSRACSPTSSPSRATRRARSPPCARCGWS